MFIKQIQNNRNTNLHNSKIPIILLSQITSTHIRNLQIISIISIILITTTITIMPNNNPLKDQSLKFREFYYGTFKHSHQKNSIIESDFFLLKLTFRLSEKMRLFFIIKIHFSLLILSYYDCLFCRTYSLQLLLKNLQLGWRLSLMILNSLSLHSLEILLYLLWKVWYSFSFFVVSTFLAN